MMFVVSQALTKRLLHPFPQRRLLLQYNKNCREQVWLQRPSPHRNATPILMLAMAAGQAEFPPFRRQVCSARCRFQPRQQVAPPETYTLAV